MNGGGGSSSAGITPDFYAGLFVAAFFPVIDLAGSVAVRCAFAPTAEKERVFLTTAVANFLVLAESRRRKKNHIWSLGRMMLLISDVAAPSGFVRPAGNDICVDFPDCGDGGGSGCGFRSSLEMHRGLCTSEAAAWQSLQQYLASSQRAQLNIFLLRIPQWPQLSSPRLSFFFDICPL